MKAVRLSLLALALLPVLGMGSLVVSMVRAGPDAPPIAEYERCILSHMTNVQGTVDIDPEHLAALCRRAGDAARKSLETDGVPAAQIDARLGRAHAQAEQRFLKLLPPCPTKTKPLPIT